MKEAARKRTRKDEERLLGRYRYFRCHPLQRLIIICLCILSDGVFHTIEILDTAGHHQFPAMRELSIKMGQAFVVVYAINNRKTFDEATRMVEKIKEIKGMYKTQLKT